MNRLEAGQQDMIAAIDPAVMLARTLAWAEVNSGTANLAGLSHMAGMLADEFSVLPGTLSLHDPAPAKRVDASGNLQDVGYGRHLVLRVRPEAQRRVILTGHMDTVFGPDQPFQTCRWLDGDTLNGPGTADMKGGLALMLAALEAFESTSPALGYDVLINSDEEAGSLSSGPLIAELAAAKVAALTYEPALAHGRMARGRPGSGNFAAVVTGRSAHAGRNPEDGRNALVAAGDLALRLSAAGQEGLSVNPARIEGGGPNNMVPALAVLHFNMRPADAALAGAAQRAIDKAVAGVGQAHDVAISVHGTFGRPPKPISAETERLFSLVQACAADLGEPLDWHDTGGVCDGNNIAACGVPVIDTMGACGGAIHSADEFLTVSSLRARAALSALVLHRLDIGELPA